MKRYWEAIRGQVRRRIMCSLLLISAVIVSVGFAAADVAGAPAEIVPALHFDIQTTLQQMQSISQRPYYFELPVIPNGRNFADQKEWDELYPQWRLLAAKLSEAVLAVDPGSIDEHAVDAIIFQFCDPLDWDGTELTRALGHIGGPAIRKLITVIEETNNPLVRDRVAARLPSVIRLANGANLSDETIDRLIALLDHASTYVRIQAAVSLSEFGSRATRALPPLKRERERILAEMQDNIGVMGRRPIDDIDPAIREIEDAQ